MADETQSRRYALYLRRQVESMGRLARYERKVAFWIGKLIAERKREGRYRGALEKLEQENAEVKT